MRLAALDYGTVTSRLVVADVQDGEIRQLAKSTAITHLGEGLLQSGSISEAAMQRVLHASRGFLAEIARHGSITQEAGHTPVKLTAVATSAMRDAQNTGELTRRLAGLGITLEVIAGQREAALSFAGTLSGFDPAETGGKAVMVVDVGGGSTELTIGQAACPGGQPQVSLSISVDIGARRVTDRWLKSDPPAPSEIAAARRWISQELLSGLGEAASKLPQVDLVIAVAGTATSLVSVSRQMENYDPDLVHGQYMGLAETRQVLDRLAALSSRERQDVVGLEAGRAPVAVGGILVLEEALGLFGQDGFTASETDILQGILLEAWHRA